MKHTSLLVIALVMSSSYVFAHDESLHAKDAEAPRCAAMKNMDHSKMKKDDPIMQAMMQKCMHHDNDHHKNHDSKHAGSENKTEDKHKKHDH